MRETIVTTADQPSLAPAEPDVEQQPPVHHGIGSRIHTYFLTGLVVAGPVSDEMIVVLVPVSASSFADAGIAAMPRTATVCPYGGQWIR